MDRLDRATLRAIRYALTLGANDVFAIHAALDPARAGELADVWMTQHMPIPLDSSSAGTERPGALEQDILRLSNDGTEVTVVMPRRDYPKFRQRMLHDRTSRRIAKTLGPVPTYRHGRRPLLLRPNRGGSSRGMADASDVK